MNKNIWLDNILGNSKPNDLSEFVGVKLEEMQGSVIQLLKKHPDFKHEKDEDLKIMATNSIVAACLSLQRATSKNSHIAMFVNCVPDHPDLAILRDELKKAAYAALKKRFKYILIYIFTAGFITAQIFNTLFF